MSEEITMRPLSDHVLVERAAADKKTAGGLFIPDNAQKPVFEGIVKAVGPGKTTSGGVLVPCDVKVGDRVVFGQYRGTQIRPLGDDMLVLREEDILAVYDG